MKCCECKHCASAYLTSLDGQGVFQAHLCQVDIVNPVVVDGGVERGCQHQWHLTQRGLPYEAALAKRRKGWRGLWHRLWMR